MNDTYGTTAYFTSQSDARSAADDLRRQGMDVDVRSSDSHGESFWESIKNFFSGEKNDDKYSGGAVLVIENGDPQSITTIVTRYNGTVGGSPNSGSGTTTGDVDYARDMRGDLQRTGARTRSDVGELADADLDGDDRTL